MPPLYFGTGRTVITPPEGIELCGYGPYLERRATAVHQDLFCTALALSDGDRVFVWVSNDLVWTDRSLVDETHRVVRGRYGLDPARVVITNTHTHSGPATTKTVAWGKWDEAYTAGLPTLFADAIGRAVSNLEPGRIGFGRTPVPNLSVNRVDEGGEADAEALLMRIDNARGRMRAAAVNFGAHPVSLGADTVVCGDYPADAIGKMEAKRDGLRALFFQGSCGDLNCRGFGEGMDVLKANGSLLLDHVLPALDEIATDPEVDLDGDAFEVALPTEIPDRATLEVELKGCRDRLEAAERSAEGDAACDADPADWRRLRFEADWRAHRLGLLDGPHPQRLELRVSWLRINDAVLIAHPLELFLTYGKQVQTASPYPHTMVIGYANETAGYLARPQDFDQEGFGWYAAVFAPRICRHLPFEPDAGTVFRDHLIALLQRIRQREPASAGRQDPESRSRPV